MKLLLDQNLSFRLVKKMEGLFPESLHVRRIGLDQETDSTIWKYAKDHDFSILTKDDDFRDMAFINGHPPKVIWLRSGNCRVDDIEVCLRNNSILIIEFLKNSNDSVMEIF